MFKNNRDHQKFRENIHNRVFGETWNKVFLATDSEIRVNLSMSTFDKIIYLRHLTRNININGLSIEIGNEIDN